MIYPSCGDVYFLSFILLESSPRSFADARTVDGTVYSNYQEAAEALGVLGNNSESEGELCFREARECGYSPKQLRGLVVTLSIEGALQRPFLRTTRISSLQTSRKVDFHQRQLETVVSGMFPTVWKPWAMP